MSDKLIRGDGFVNSLIKLIRIIVGYVLKFLFKLLGFFSWILVMMLNGVFWLNIILLINYS